MTKANNSPSNKTPYLAVIVILALLVIAMAFLYTQKSSAYSQEVNSYGNLNSKYTSFKTQSQDQVSGLQTQVSTLQTQLTSNKTLLLNMSKKYNTTEYNLTHPYTEILFNDHTLSLPPLNATTTYNYTTNNYTINWFPANYTYVFNARYPGFLILNMTGTGNLSKTYILVSTLKPYKLYNLFYENASYNFYPTQGRTYYIPILNGTNYFIIQNLQYTGITITFNLKYVGFHTS